MKRVKIVLRYIFGLISSITLVILVCLLLAKSVVNKDFFKKILDDTNYYQLVYDEIKEEMKDYITSSGFENEILDNIYSQDEVNSDIELFLDNAFNSKKTYLDKKNINEILNENINKILKENNLDVINKEEIALFENDIVDIYKNEITLYGMADSVITRIDSINNLINKGIIMSSIIFITLLIIMIILGGIRYFGSIILASGLIFAFLYIVIFENIDSANLLIITTYFSLCVEKIIRYIGDLLLKMSIINVIIGVLLSFTLSCKWKRNKG